ncbi:MAG: CBS domain-containing protein [Methanomicrobiales archaeon]|nr:CBS domain-containing protein [Methanomicrobiales archaeon]
MDASEIMTSPVYVIAPEDTVAHARNLMLKHKISRCPVLKGNRLVGIITKKDLAYRLRSTEPLWRRRPIDRVPVNVIMTPDPITVTPGTGIRTIAALMLEHGISGLPVQEQDAILGIITKTDLLVPEIAAQMTQSVREVMHPVETVSRYHSLDHVIDIMSEQNDKVVVVNNDGTLAGIITESNIAFFIYSDDTLGVPERDVLMLRREEPAGRKSYRFVVDVSAVAEDVMSRPVQTVSSGSTLGEVVEQMYRHQVNSIVVLDGDELKGIVKRDDIIKEVAK